MRTIYPIGDVINVLGEEYKVIKCIKCIDLGEGWWAISLDTHAYDGIQPNWIVDVEEIKTGKPFQIIV